MFGDMMGMMGKIKEAQAKVEETKKQLDHQIMSEVSPDGKIKIEITANREIKNIIIDPSLATDMEELEDMLLITINRAVSNAHAQHEAALGAAARDGMPDLSGFGM